MTDTIVAPSSDGKVSTRLGDAILAHLTHESDTDYETVRMHYGSDLDPQACYRKIWYRLHDVAPDAEDLGSQIRFWGGRNSEQLVVDALVHSGLRVKTQVLVRPLRPSAWCWSPGRADVVVADWKHLLEIKAPRAAYFARARSDPRILAKTSYRYQISAYFHELRARGLVETASFLFLDREGANQPIELPLDESLLVPVEAIVEQERAKAYLIDAKEPPDRIGRVTHVKILKGGRATKKAPVPERKLEATSKLSWRCQFCQFRGTCQPGADEAPHVLTADERAKALARAEAIWTKNPKAAAKIVLGGDEDDVPPEIVEEQAGEDRQVPLDPPAQAAPGASPEAASSPAPIAPTIASSESPGAALEPSPGTPASGVLTDAERARLAGKIESVVVEVPRLKGGTPAELEEDVAVVTMNGGKEVEEAIESLPPILGGFEW